MKTKPIFLIFLTLFSFTLAITSCKKDPKDTPDVVKPSAYYVQNWIYSNMKYWYYWTSQMPANPDTTMQPEPFFYSLLYKSTDGDRFSWIEPDYTTLINELNGITKEAGYDFRLYLASAGSTDVIGQITYIKKGSPAESAGLIRGDIFYQINSTPITTSNYRTLLNATGSPFTLKVKRYNPDTKEIISDQGYSLNPVELAENPVLMDSVYTFNGKKVGYLVYNFFSPGSGTSKPYDQEVDNVFSDFKAKGVNEVVLDLRFNGGGAISSAVNLASLLVPAFTSSKIFVNFQYNNQVQSDIINDPNYGAAYLHQKFIAKTSNIGDNLSRIFVLTSGGTASASELIINGLRPYITVTTIGDTTYGKNVGSVTITDKKNTTNTWGLQPIVLKLTNSLGFSDYTNGFAPDPVNYDADNQYFLRPLGDIHEPLLNKALYIITNGSMLKSAQPFGIARKEIKGANQMLKPHKTSMYLDPEMSPFNK
jgi:carboxyl-terminal processing protease